MKDDIDELSLRSVQSSDQDLIRRGEVLSILCSTCAVSNLIVVSSMSPDTSTMVSHMYVAISFATHRRHRIRQAARVRDERQIFLIQRCPEY